MKEIQLLPWQPLAGHLPHRLSCTELFPSSSSSWFKSRGVSLLEMAGRECVCKAVKREDQQSAQDRKNWPRRRKDHTTEGEDRPSGVKMNAVMDGKQAFKGTNRISLVETPGRDRGVLII